MEFSLISPRLVIQKNDFLGSGVPYWPLELATFASFIRLQNDDVKMYDLFGNNPQKLSDKGTHYLQGEHINKYIGPAFYATIGNTASFRVGRLTI